MVLGRCYLGSTIDLHPFLILKGGADTTSFLNPLELMIKHARLCYLVFSCPAWFDGLSVQTVYPSYFVSGSSH